MHFKIMIFCFFIIVSQSCFAYEIESSMRWWNPQTRGTVGDANQGASVYDKSDTGLGLAFRVDFGRTITELVYSRFNIGSPILNNNQLMSTPFRTSNQSEFIIKMDTYDLHARNLIHKNKNISLRWSYGITYLEADISQSDILGSSAKVESSGVVPMLGIEAEWYIRNSLRMRSHYRFGDRNIGSDDMRLKDFEVALIWAPWSATSLELGYRNLSVDLNKQFTGHQSFLKQDYRGLYSQVNLQF
tara:strand:- start:1928 stop:2659 length:732 start_codon:yes stop_codon:yes gene_type:complete